MCIYHWFPSRVGSQSALVCTVIDPAVAAPIVLVNESIVVTLVMALQCIVSCNKTCALFYCFGNDHAIGHKLGRQEGFFRLKNPGRKARAQFIGFGGVSEERRRERHMAWQHSNVKALATYKREAMASDSCFMVAD